MTPVFEPYPLGCPLSLRVVPSEMPRVIAELLVELQDLLPGAIHEIHAADTSYPIVSLFADELEQSPRLVLFPAWSSDSRSDRSWLRFRDQCRTLEQIAASGDEGEPPGRYRDAAAVIHPGAGPLLLPLAVTADQMEAVVHDLLGSLSDLLRITVLRVPHREAELWVLSLYSLVEERPRVVLFPGWVPTQQGLLELTTSDALELLRTGLAQRLPELPIEAFGPAVPRPRSGAPGGR